MHNDSSCLRLTELVNCSMANLVILSNYVICVSGSNVRIFELGSATSRQLRVSVESSEQKDGCVEKKEGAPDETSANVATGEGDSTGQILACGASRSGRYFATCDDAKWLTVWRTGGGERGGEERGEEGWEQLSRRQVARRCTSLTFTRREDEVVVADKSGDAYAFSVCSTEVKGRLLLGHVSMLLDLALNRDDRYLFTCDRDEKIRVSLYPKSHNIESFCLGHTHFVSRLCYIEDEDILLSGSGDGTIRAWDYCSGTQLGAATCQQQLEPAGDEPPSVRSLVYCQRRHLVAVSFYRRSSVLVYALRCHQGAVSLEARQRLDGSTAIVWDTTFDGDGRLWTLSGDGVRVFTQSDDTAQFELMSADHGDVSRKLLTTVTSINSESQIFEECQKADDLYSILSPKVKLDNQLNYMRRKQQRIDSKRKPVATSGEEQTNQPTDTSELKKCKTNSA